MAVMQALAASVLMGAGIASMHYNRDGSHAGTGNVPFTIPLWWPCPLSFAVFDFPRRACGINVSLPGAEKKGVTYGDSPARSRWVRRFQ